MSLLDHSRTFPVALETENASVPSRVGSGNVNVAIRAVHSYASRLASVQLHAGKDCTSGGIDDERTCARRTRHIQRLPVRADRNLFRSDICGCDCRRAQNDTKHNLLHFISSPMT